MTSGADIGRMAADWAVATSVETAVFGLRERALLGGAQALFCLATCPLAADGRCDPRVAHQFGCYEAERWGGQFIFYCPASLVFVATLVYEQGVPSHGLVAGPVVMGPLDDLVGDLDPKLRDLANTLPGREPAEVGALARVQQALCRTLSTESSGSTEARPGNDSSTVPPPGASGPEHEYPFEVEKRLVGMIRRGDRAGAAGLINELLAALYQASDGNFPRLRQGATDLITLFSRAAIDGGADVRSIFGEKRVVDRRLAGFTSLEQLSGFLVTVFNRFVGYVFDFSKFQHANILRQTVSYIRAHYAEHITLADVARHVWMSPSYLSSVFSAEMGMSFTMYVQSVRIAKSKELLAGTHQTVAEIAAETGFSDQSYFTKVFTKAVGVSPTQFRRQELNGRG